MKIALLGFMGCGKTSYGKKLAKQLSLSFIDLDQQIENGENKSISMIFEIYGERYFRFLESKYLEDILNKEEDFVLATGGGTPILKENFQLLQKETKTVFLNLPFGILYSRLQQGENKRPLVQLKSREELESVFECRLPIYQKAHYSINPMETKAADLFDKLKIK